MLLKKNCKGYNLNVKIKFDNAKLGIFDNF